MGCHHMWYYPGCMNCFLHGRPNFKQGAGVPYAQAKYENTVTLEMRNDLDETRRLLYIVLAADNQNKKHELVGTLINALTHHSKLTTNTWRATSVALHGAMAGVPGDMAWVEGLIDNITERLSVAEGVAR